MEMFQVRPRFKRRSIRPVAELLEEVRTVLAQHSTEVKGNVYLQQAVIAIPEEERHFWSPQLSLTFEEEEEGTLIRGLYGPHPHVWLLYTSIYFLAGLAVLILSIVGLSQLQLGLGAYILWLVPFLLGGVLVLWLSSRTGQKLGDDQRQRIHRLVGERVLRDSVPVE